MGTMRGDTIFGKRVAVVTVPFTFTEKVPRELGQVSIETLRFVSYLKACANQVHFINLRSAEKFAWKTRRAGIRSTGRIKMGVFSKSQDFLRAEFSKGPAPEEILLWCDFSFFPYTFDLDVIRSLKTVCLAVFPRARVRVGGIFWDILASHAAEAGLEVFRVAEGAPDAYPPDFSEVAGESYGLFQLSKGCVNSCSFCVAGRTRPHKFENAETLRYMRRLADRGIREFWNWDQNVLLSSAHFEDFLDKYRESGIDGTLHFSLGLQPNLISGRLIAKLGALRLGTLAVPFETGTSESYRMVGKPYTIISPIKRVFEIDRRVGGSIKRLICPFIIGYPHDDFRSIFRIYLSILRLRAKPLPFPLCLFPNTAVYRANAGALKGKSMAELHGQLWPLVADVDVPAYRKLFRFLAIDSLSRAEENLHLLSAPMLAALKEELRINGAFVDLCLSARSEDVAELEKIEKKISCASFRRLSPVRTGSPPAGKPASKKIAKVPRDFSGSRNGRPPAGASGSAR